MHRWLQQQGYAGSGAGSDCVGGCSSMVTSDLMLSVIVYVGAAASYCQILRGLSMRSGCSCVVMPALTLSVSV